MIVINAGVPRSGTVLVNAIVRHLLKKIAPNTLQTNPNSTEMLGVVQKLVSTGQDKYRTCLLHTHSWPSNVAKILANSPHTRTIVNHRDPRDVTVSLMKLHDHDFESAANLAYASFAQMHACINDTDALVLPYEFLVTGKEMAIFQIARHLGLSPKHSEIRSIAQETSIEKHAQVMKNVKDGSLETLMHKRNTHRVLSEDKVTLINDRHIQSGAIGRWQTELSSSEQALANTRFATIFSRFGYDQTSYTAQARNVL